MYGAQNTIGEIVGDQTFVVVGKHQRVKFLERGKKQPQKSFLGFGAERLAALAINANHLLVPRDDPRFHRSDAFRIGDDAFIRDVRGAKAFLQYTPGLVIADYPERFHARAEYSDICGDIPRPAQDRKS